MGLRCTFVFYKVCISVNMHNLSFYYFKDEVIQQDDEIRLKIVGTRVDAKDIVSDLLMKK